HRLEQPARVPRARRRGDRNVEIEIGQISAGFGNETLARQLQHCGDDAHIGDIAGAHLALNHHPARRGKVEHRGPTCRIERRFYIAFPAKGQCPRWSSTVRAHWTAEQGAPCPLSTESCRWRLAPV